MNRNSVDILPTSPESEPSNESEQGVYNFRALLRKTRVDPSRTLRKPLSSDVDEQTPKIDYRSVLKKRPLSEVHKQVLAS